MKKGRFIHNRTVTTTCAHQYSQGYHVAANKRIVCTHSRIIWSFLRPNNLRSGWAPPSLTCLFSPKRYFSKLSKLCPQCPGRQGAAFRQVELLITLRKHCQPPGKYVDVARVQHKRWNGGASIIYALNFTATLALNRYVMVFD